MMLLRCCCLKSQIQRQRSNWEGGPCPSVANDRLRQTLIGYARVSKADGSQSLDLRRDAAGRGRTNGLAQWPRSA